MTSDGSPESSAGPSTGASKNADKKNSTTRAATAVNISRWTKSDDELVFFTTRAVSKYSQAPIAISEIYKHNHSVLDRSEAYSRVIAARFSFVDILWTSGGFCGNA